MLQELVRRGSEHGATVAVRSQFSADRARDLLVQATTVQADSILVDVADRQLAESLAGTVDATLVLRQRLLAPEGEPVDQFASVVVLPGPGDDGAAAVEQALLLAERHGLPVVLLDAGDRRDGRRLAGWCERLVEIGVQARVEHSIDAARAPDSVFVVGLRGGLAKGGLSRALAVDPRPGTTLLVAAPPGDRGEGLMRRLDARRGAVQKAAALRPAQAAVAVGSEATAPAQSLDLTTGELLPPVGTAESRAVQQP